MVILNLFTLAIKIDHHGPLCAVETKLHAPAAASSWLARIPSQNVRNGLVIHDLPLQPSLVEFFLIHLIQYHSGLPWEFLAIGLVLRTQEYQSLEIMQLEKHVGSKFGQSPKDDQESLGSSRLCSGHGIFYPQHSDQLYS